VQFIFNFFYPSYPFHQAALTPNSRPSYLP
jgi:hypothetical protein